jgi:hypothetical protein
MVESDYTTIANTTRMVDDNEQRGHRRACDSSCDTKNELQKTHLLHKKIQNRIFARTHRTQRNLDVDPKLMNTLKPRFCDGLSLFICIVGCVVNQLSWIFIVYSVGLPAICSLPPAVRVRCSQNQQGYFDYTYRDGDCMRHPTRKLTSVLNAFHGSRQPSWAASMKTPTPWELYSRVNDDTSFDFSSKLGWDQYYQTTSLEESVEEWHASIPLETIASCCPPSRPDCEILMIGCGTSRLVDVILDQHTSQGVNTRITLLDSSSTCIDALKRRYRDYSQKEKLRYVCGDAVHLSSSLSNLDGAHIGGARYDYIIDKGFMDALFCGEGWNTPVAALLSEASSLMNASGALSRYVLISYRLPKATKEYLIDLSAETGFHWDFDCAGSNRKVGISVATKVVQ